MSDGVRIQGGRNWVMVRASCTDPLAGLPMLTDRSITHVITDPPYEAEAHTKGRRIKAHLGGGLYGVDSAPLGFAAITADLRTEAAREIGRVVQRWALAFCQVEAVPDWAAAFEAGGLHYKRACVWIKPDGQPQLTGDRPGMGYETIVSAHTPGRSRWNGGGKCGVYTAMRHQDHGPRHLRHPTVKPLPLMESLIRDFTDPGDFIADPFAGSGSTGVAALKLGRKFIGWEIDDSYFDLACKRLRETREQTDLLDRGRFELDAGQKRTQSTLLLPEPGE